MKLSVSLKWPRMNFIKYLFTTKKLICKNFQFVENQFGFYKTNNSKLLFPEWEKFSVAYTNNKFVIIVCDDILEKKVSIIIYKIQEDYTIPLNNKELYFTIEDVCIKNKIEFSVENFYYNNYKSYKNALKYTSSLLSSSLNYLFNV